MFKVFGDKRTKGGKQESQNYLWFPKPDEGEY